MPEISEKYLTSELIKIYGHSDITGNSFGDELVGIDDILPHRDNDM